MKVFFVIKLFLVLLLRILLCHGYTNELAKNPAQNEVEKVYLRIFFKLRECEDISECDTKAIRYKRSDQDPQPKTAFRISKPDDKNSTVTTNATEKLEHSRLIADFKKQWPVLKWQEFGLFSDDYLDLINEHWLRFPPPNAYLQKTLGGVYVLFTTLGCAGNIIVLFMYIR